LLDTKQELLNIQVLSVPVLGDDNLLANLLSRGLRYPFIGLGTIEDTRPRKWLYQKARGLGFIIVQAIHPQSVIAASAKTGQGITIMAGAIVNAATRIGQNVIINKEALLNTFASSEIMFTSPPGLGWQGQFAWATEST
jgi:UDP-perosamine 4-acetyltransferase